MDLTPEQQMIYERIKADFIKLGYPVFDAGINALISMGLSSDLIIVEPDGSETFASDDP